MKKYLIALIAALSVLATATPANGEGDVTPWKYDSLYARCCAREEINMFKVSMYSRTLKKILEMPTDINLGLFEACYRADLYAKSNRADFFVINEENGDIEYEVKGGE